MRSRHLLILACCVAASSACGGKSKAEPAAAGASSVGAEASPTTAAQPPVAEPVTAKPASDDSCVAWSATEHPNAPKQGTCAGVATSIQQGDCGHYVSIKNDAGTEAVFICWEPCEVLQSDNPPVWQGKRLRVQWNIGKLAVAGHEQCKNDAAALATAIELVP